MTGGAPREAENLALFAAISRLDAAMNVPRRSDRFVSRNIGDETVVVPVREGVANLEKIFTMNGVGSAIWTRIDGKTSVGELARAICAEFDVTEAEADADVAAFLELLAAKSLVEEAGATK